MEKVITMRFEDEDKELVRQRAKASGLDMASFCRFIVLQAIKNDGDNHGRDFSEEM